MGWGAQTARRKKLGVVDGDINSCSTGVSDPMATAFFCKSWATQQMFRGLFAAVATHPRRDFYKLVDPEDAGKVDRERSRAGEDVDAYRALHIFFTSPHRKRRVDSESEKVCDGARA